MAVLGLAVLPSPARLLRDKGRGAGVFRISVANSCPLPLAPLPKNMGEVSNATAACQLRFDTNQEGGGISG